jgi:hypothetical protein
VPALAAALPAAALASVDPSAAVVLLQLPLPPLHAPPPTPKITTHSHPPVPALAAPLPAAALARVGPSAAPALSA